MGQVGHYGEYCTVAEAAQLLDVSRSTVWRWIESGRLRAHRIGPKTTRISLREIATMDERGSEDGAEDNFEARTGIWEGYDPERAWAAFRKAHGLLKGIDGEKLIREIYQDREQDSIGRPAALGEPPR